MKDFQNDLLVQEKELQDKLKNSKLFLNMCIHDMRNPANTIQLGLQHTIESFSRINAIYKSHISYSSDVARLLQAADQNEAGQELIEQISPSNRISVLHETVINYHKAREMDSIQLKQKLEHLSEIIKMSPLQYQESKFGNPYQIEFDEDFDPACFEEMSGMAQMGGLVSKSSLLLKERQKKI